MFSIHNLHNTPLTSLMSLHSKFKSLLFIIKSTFRCKDESAIIGTLPRIKFRMYLGIGLQNSTPVWIENRKLKYFLLI